MKRNLSNAVLFMLIFGCFNAPCVELEGDVYGDYCQIVQSMRTAKTRFTAETGAGTMSQATADRIRKYVYRQIADSLFPCWLDTPWGFYGTTQIPGSGTIACGYLVTTLLQHAGFRINRIRVAQLAAEKIIKALTPASFIHRYSDISLDRFCSAMSALGDGLYVVGLDCHVGFLYVHEKELFFLHSTYVGPACVIREKASESKVLESSRYRVVGKLLATKELVRQWIDGM